jgi:hypothetical protein
MSWQAVAPFAGRATAAPVSMAQRAGGRFQRTLRLTISPALLEQPPGFLMAGASIAVMRGIGEHAGMIRLVPNGPFKVGRAGGRETALVVSIPPFSTSDVAKHPSEAVEFEYADGWLDVTLPAWAKAPAPTPTPRAVAVAPGAPKVSGRDPFAVAQELRAGARP